MVKLTGYHSGRDLYVNPKFVALIGGVLDPTGESITRIYMPGVGEGHQDVAQSKSEVARRIRKARDAELAEAMRANGDTNADRSAA